MKKSFQFLAVVAFGFSCLTGCGGKDNTVIQPDAQYQPSEQGLKNEEALRAAGENPPKTVDPKKPDFSGN